MERIAGWNCSSTFTWIHIWQSQKSAGAVWSTWVVLWCNDYFSIGVWALDRDLQRRSRTWRTPIDYRVILVSKAVRIHFLKNRRTFTWRRLPVMPANFLSPFQLFLECAPSATLFYAVHSCLGAVYVGKWTCSEDARRSFWGCASHGHLCLGQLIFSDAVIYLNGW